MSHKRCDTMPHPEHSFFGNYPAGGGTVLCTAGIEWLSHST